MQEEINKAIETLRKGGIILYPTDTIWGIGCDATNPAAVEKIYRLKQRAESKAMLVLMSSVAELERYVEEVPEIAYDLIDVAVRPLTVIYDNAVGLADNLVAKDGSIGIRITQEAFSSQLCRRFRKPIVSTSANISGTPSPINFQDISREIIDAVDYVVNFRRDENIETQPSSVIKLSASGVIKIIRP